MLITKKESDARVEDAANFGSLRADEFCIFRNSGGQADSPDPMQVDQATVGRTLRNKKEKVPKHLKRGANDKEMDSFTIRILRIPLDKQFEEAYFTHRL
ncbi:hypothetical protein F2Q70_00026020 [Brassica cretica]|uniref:Uncharacterized protein n=1 Tax=Brassica cretica TaxID=69181 RepID=A0A8S9L7G0_BRACR|nr:hypothetical protein F2Q70_00026020 [Brassica cretica]